MTADAVGVAIGTLERSVRGPGRARAELLREVRDGLEDAVDAYREAGLDPVEARRRAVQDFGDAREVAAALQEELAAGYGRGAAARMAVAFPALVVLWDLVWATGSQPGGTPPAAGILARLIDGLSFTAAAACGIALVLLWSRGRRGVPAARVTTGVGVLGLCTLAGVGGGSVLLNVLNTGRAASAYSDPPAFGVLAVTVGVAAWLCVSGQRCLRLGRLARSGP